MSTLAIVLVVLAALVALLLIGGLIAARRRRGEVDADLRRRLDEANRALAAAHAHDKGWERGGLEAAARDAFAARSEGTITELQLVQVVDRPGTDDDVAVFRVVTADGSHEVRLARHGGAWLPG